MLLRQFRSFYARHFPNDMEQLIDYFSVFGGLGWEVDVDTPIEELIVTHVLENYGHLYNQIALKTLGDASYHRLLSALAIGDRRMHSAFKRARISDAKGGAALNYLRDCGLLEMEYSREAAPVKAYPKQKLKREIVRHRISHKLRFTSPFLRFWFYFIAPNHREIEQGNYESVLRRFEQHHQSFTGLIYEELSNLYLTELFTDDPIVDSGSYWDRQVEIDILVQTQSGKEIVGECKWTNHKINKKELGKLMDKCEKISLDPAMVVIFSKRGFSNELEQLRSDRLRLFSCNDLEPLLQDVSGSDLISGFAPPE